MTAPDVRRKVDAALAEVTAAEESLERALRDLTSAPRGDKVVITDVMRSAFIRLRSAREAVASLHDAIEAADDV